MNWKKINLLDQYKGTSSCEPSPQITTGGFPGGGRSVQFIPIEDIIATEIAGEFSLIQEGGIRTEDFIEASNKAYAELAPDERHELSVWDATLDDGLNEY